MAWLALCLVLALVLFWAVGAYSRLKRLRAEVLRQWATVDTLWLKWLMRFQGSISARQMLAWPSEADDLQILQDGSDTIIEALADARQRMFDPASLQKLSDRHVALMASIDTVAERVPETVRPHLLSAQARILRNIPAALLPYNAAVMAYNVALEQVPTRWLARSLKLRPACRMRWPAHPNGPTA